MTNKSNSQKHTLTAEYIGFIENLNYVNENIILLNSLFTAINTSSLELQTKNLSEIGCYLTHTLSREYDRLCNELANELI